MNECVESAESKTEEPDIKPEPRQLRYPSLANYDPISCLQLLRSDNVGAITFYQLLANYGSPEAAISALPRFYASKSQKRDLKPCSRQQAEQEYEKATSFGATLLRYGETDYPSLLEHTYDPPPLLTALGDSTLLKRPSTVAIVGARNASSHARSFAATLGKELGASNCVIASGLARGIDTIAHHASVETGTVAVTACGIDQIYPAENSVLYNRIAESGLILTEQPFGTSPVARHFPRRNRIISGISHGVAIIEASMKSGTLITARFALEQGREVFAVPGFPLDPRSRGTNHLIRQGAMLLESSQDIIDTLLHHHSLFSHAGSSAGTLHSLREKAYESPLFISPIPQTESIEMPTDSEERVLSALHFTPLAIDILSRDSGVTPAALQTILLELELAGRIERHAGGCVSLAPTS